MTHPALGIVTVVAFGLFLDCPPCHSARNLEANLGDFQVFGIEVPGKLLLHVP